MDRHSKSKRAFVSILSVLFFVFSVSLVAAESPSTAQDDTVPVVGYRVQAGRLIKDPSSCVSATDELNYQKIWEAVTTLIPSPLIDEVGRFELFSTKGNESASSETDGYAVLSDDGSSFVLGLNLESATGAFIEKDSEVRKELIRTVIHEFGHIISLGPSQLLAPDQKGNGLMLDEGTLRDDSLLNRFYDLFWKNAYPQHSIDATSDEEGQALYNRSSSSFVTSYAATGPLEDFAETFSVFVLDDRNTETSIRSRKISFFYGDPSLVNLRAEIRKRFSRL